MKTVVSGIRSTGNLHLGNYYGALKNFIRMQENNRCFFFIAYDYRRPAFSAKFMMKSAVPSIPSTDESMQRSYVCATPQSPNV